VAAFLEQVKEKLGEFLRPPQASFPKHRFREVWRMKGIRTEREEKFFP